MTAATSDPGGTTGGRVLMILYHFPPLGGISMSRNIRHAQYLPGHGWVPTVVTPRDPTWQPRDPTSLALVPEDLAVIRTRSVEPGHLRRAAGRVRAATRGRPIPDHGIPGTASRIVSDAPSGSETSLRSSLRRWLFFPDDQVGWIPFAVVAGWRAYRREPFDTVFSTSSPISAHLAAGLIKRMTGVRWVAEFRDPWVGNALARPAPWLQRRLQVKLERWIVRSADAVVFVTPTLTRMYVGRYPGIEATTITNGYDRSETRSGSHPDRRPDRSARFSIVYTGTLDRPTELMTFLAGVRGLLARRPELTRTLTVDFYGERSPAADGILTQAVEDGLGGIVRAHGFVPRAQALAAVAAADAALVLLADGPGMDLFVGGKLYDYLGQDTDILAMVPDGDAAAVLRDLGWGEIARPDPGDVERVLERLLSRGRPVRQADPTGRYDRRRLTGSLALVLAGRSRPDLDSSAGPSR